MNTSEQVNELFAALAKAQGEIEVVARDKKNPHFRSTYATIAAVKEAVRGPLAKHGLAIVQTVESIDFNVSGLTGYILGTTLTHSSGQWITATLKLLLDKQNMQGLGSAITYARRYSLASMVGVVDEDDDDGNKAVSTEFNQNTDSRFNADPNVVPKEVQRIREQNARSEAEAKRILDKSAEPLFDPSAFVVNFGKKYQGQTLGELGFEIVQSQLDWVNNSAKQPLGQKLLDFKQAAEQFLGVT